MGFWTKAVGGVVGAIAKERLGNEAHDRTRMPGDDMPSNERDDFERFLRDNPGFDKERFLEHAAASWDAMYRFYADLDRDSVRPYLHEGFFNDFHNWPRFKDGGGFIDEHLPRVLRNIGIEAVEEQYHVASSYVRQRAGGPCLRVRAMGMVPMAMRTRADRDRRGTIAVDDLIFGADGDTDDPVLRYVVIDFVAVDTPGPDVDLSKVPTLGKLLGL